MRSDSVKNMSAYADQNYAPSLAAARLEYKNHTQALCRFFVIKTKGDYAYAIFDVDSQITEESVQHITDIEGVLKVRVIK